MIQSLPIGTIFPEAVRFALGCGTSASLSKDSVGLGDGIVVGWSKDSVGLGDSIGIGWSKDGVGLGDGCGVGCGSDPEEEGGGAAKQGGKINQRHKLNTTGFLGATQKTGYILAMRGVSPLQPLGIHYARGCVFT